MPLRPDIPRDSDMRKVRPDINELKSVVRTMQTEARRLSDAVAELRLREKKHDRGGGAGGCAKWA